MERPTTASIPSIPTYRGLLLSFHGSKRTWPYGDVDRGRPVPAAIGTRAAVSDAHVHPCGASRTPGEPELGPYRRGARQVCPHAGDVMCNCCTRVEATNGSVGQTGVGSLRHRLTASSMELKAPCAAYRAKPHPLASASPGYSASGRRRLHLSHSSTGRCSLFPFSPLSKTPQNGTNRLQQVVVDWWYRRYGMNRLFLTGALQYQDWRSMITFRYQLIV